MRVINLRLKREQEPKSDYPPIHSGILYYQVKNASAMHLDLKTTSFGTMYKHAYMYVYQVK